MVESGGISCLLGGSSPRHPTSRKPRDLRHPAAKAESDGVGGSAGHPSAIAQGRLSRKAREVAHPQLFRWMLKVIQPAFYREIVHNSRRARLSSAWFLVSLTLAFYRVWVIVALRPVLSDPWDPLGPTPTTKSSVSPASR